MQNSIASSSLSDMNNLNCLLILLSLFSWAPAYAAPPAPVKLIFDTDMGNDIDDALALAMIHTLADRGECELLAVTVTKDHPQAAPFVDLLNTYYGRPSIPIGAVKKGMTPEQSKYTVLAGLRDNGKPKYPHDLLDGTQAPNATAILRATLAEQPDNSVVIAQVGFSTNLARLMESKPDDYSSLDGMALIEKKVKHVEIMAGAFTAIGKNTRFLEYNVVKDIANARKILQSWPTDVIASGFEIGIALPYPARSILEDFRYDKDHPIPAGYQLYEPTPHERPTWDLTSVLHGVRPSHQYFELSPRGTIKVHDDGFTEFAASKDGNRQYLILKSSQRERVREAMTSLTSQPPR